MQVRDFWATRRVDSPHRRENRAQVRALALWMGVWLVLLAAWALVVMWAVKAWVL